MQESNCASRKLFGSSSFFARRIVLVSWLAATATLSVFVSIFLILTFYAAPAQDDFCFAYANLHEGFARTVSIYYNSLVGRIVPLFVIQFSSAIAKTFGISLLSAYSATLAACMIALLAGSAFAVARAFTDLASEVRIFLCAAFCVALIAATRSPNDLLY
jgi:hypothetical protein